MRNQRNYYRILHVDRDAPPAVIKASYRTIMKRLAVHPDLRGDTSEAALLNEAFETLSDPAKRAAYDKTREAPSAQRGHPAGPKREPAAAGAPSPSAPGCLFCGTPPTEPVQPDSICANCRSPLYPARQHDAGEASRRAMERISRELPCAFRRNTAAHRIERGYTMDISLNGLRLVSQVRLRTGDLLGIENEFCAAVAVVRSVSPTAGRTGWECGAEFLTLRLARTRGGLISTVA